jgi:hypothetical protein
MTKFLSYWKPFLEKINHTFDDSVEISTSNGSVSGKVYVIDDGRTVNAFLGVPFASCGTHDHRFQVKSRIIFPYAYLSFRNRRKFYHGKAP